MNSSEPIRLSRWVHIFCNDNGSIALYHSLNIDVVYLSHLFKPLLNILKLGTTIDFINQHLTSLDCDSSARSVVLELEKKGFIVPVKTNDMVLLEEKRKELSSIGIETLYLLLSDYCNLRCSYCFIHSGMPKTYKRKTMNWGTARTAIDMFFTNIAKNPPRFKKSRKTILFYGGEPLLNFTLLRQAVLYVENTYMAELVKMGNGFIFSVITNGTLLTEEMAAFFAKHSSIAVTVSLDGPSNINDQKRFYANGRGTYELAARGLLLLKQAGCNGVSLSCTVDDHNIDHLEEILALSDKYNIVAINLNPLLDTEQKEIDDMYLRKVNMRMIEYFLLARQKGVYEERIMRKIRPFISHRVRPYDCQATGGQVVCSPDGQLGICQEGLGMKNFFFGRVSSEFSFHTNPMIKEWGQRSPLTMPQCFNCSAIGICGGGCAYGARLRNGSIWSVDSRFCKHSLATLEWIIWDIYEQSLKKTQYPC